eukprot:COSAG06_NODE_41317_length_392_cov_1.436860_1_plen_45_part_10
MQRRGLSALSAVRAFSFLIISRCFLDTCTNYDTWHSSASDTAVER